MRLDRYLSNAKVGSRSYVKKLIREGLVKVNNVVVTDPSFEVKPEDKVFLEGNPVAPHRLVYLVFNKPAGYVSDRTDYEASIFDLIDHPYIDELHVAGRLDKDVEGMMILTNDGQFTHKLISPKYKIEKEYHVIFRGKIDQEKLSKAHQGVYIDGEKFTPKKIEVISDNLLCIVLTEGKHHEVKKILKYLGVEYEKIKRVRIGKLSLQNLEPGTFKELSEEEKQLLLLNP
ncbi:pseudouridine synthase [Pseudothermotoga thermarum]|uniref:Ribosomal small subunit pseudouridine synthase A n=1 Tax=Pseudothermotoga thermarum DSM 5069 TaxID=688269 RepID=F7YTR4_9THEM|nr:pseudouridine synthase [Pseudothermotoga thermarum]AEH51293.1 ribosomal small subunit pseudouridine synthase A [Pseudothermotoga thermarum DSM 5069]